MEEVGLLIVEAVLNLLPWVSIVLSVFGVVNNVINLVVFHRQGILADSCTPCLVGLAVFDWCVCLMGTVTNTMTTYNNLQYVYGGYILVLTTLIVDVSDVFLQTTGCITFFLSLERMVSVTFPFKAKSLLTPHRSCIALACIIIASTGLILPTKVSLYIQHEWGRRYRLKFGDWIGMEFVQWLTFVNRLIIRGVCIVGVVVCNVIITVKVVVSKQFRIRISAPTSDGGTHDTKTDGKNWQKTPRSLDKRRKESRLTRMMVVVCVVFVLCFTPRLLIHLAEHFLYYEFGDVVIILELTRPIIEVVNSSCNFLIYVSMSTKFRKELRQLFGCQKKKPQ